MRGVLGLDAFWGYFDLRSYAFTAAGTVGQRGRLALAVAVRGVAALARGRAIARARSARCLLGHAVDGGGACERARCERQAGGHDDAAPGYECRGAHGPPLRLVLAAKGVITPALRVVLRVRTS